MTEQLISKLVIQLLHGDQGHRVRLISVCLSSTVLQDEELKVSWCKLCKF